MFDCFVIVTYSIGASIYLCLMYIVDPESLNRQAQV